MTLAEEDLFYRSWPQQTYDWNSEIRLGGWVGAGGLANTTWET
jgi:hypothetical protein